MTSLPRTGRRTAVPMILPEFEPATGDVLRRLHYRDARVPVPISYDSSPYLIASWSRNEHCPNGRHLWDALIATGQAHLDDEEAEHCPFRLLLTCVRCGLIQRLAGTTDEAQVGTVGQLDPEPLVSGQLRAQQISAGLLQEWHVFDAAGARVAHMCTGVTRRGRHYVEGRLEDVVAPVQGATAAACLRKLAKALTEGGAG